LSDRSELHRQVARECLELARKAKDPGVRAVLIGMAERSLERAGASGTDDLLNDLLRDYNDRKMSDE
jgi:hypothetical protein